MSEDIKGIAEYDLILATSRAIPELKGRSCIAGLHYENLENLASVGLLFNVNGEYIWIQHSFIRRGFLEEHAIKVPIKEWREQGFVTIIDESYIAPEHLTNWLIEQRKSYNIKLVTADGFRMDALIPSLKKAGFQYESIYELRSTHKGMVSVIQDGFLKQCFIFGKDQMMRWYTWNSYTEKKPDGRKVFKAKPVLNEKGFSQARTEGFMAFVFAMNERDLLQLNDIPLITKEYIKAESEQICEIPKDKGIKITCRIRQSAAIKQLDDFMERQIIPLKEKYPHIEIDIEIG